LLRPGGKLSFLTNSFLLMLCVPDQDGEPATDRLVRPAFGMHRVEFPDDPGVEFHISHSDWIRVLRESGFEVTAQIDIRPHEDARSRYPFATHEWARKWPSEEVWKALKKP